MKQCPVCKAAYADDSLSFCLNDGATLLSAADEQVTQVASIRNTNRTDFRPDAANAAPNFQNQTSTPTRQSSKTAFIVAALAALLLLIVLGAVAAFILVPRDNGNSISNAPTPTPKDDKQNEKIANLERQIQDLKKSPAPSSSNLPAPLNPSGKATARVKPASDGFLAMRSAPNAETGYQILKIPSGATVELEDCRQSYQTIAGRRGRWCMVSYAGETGWAFDGWLEY
ncbi:MAG TPA: hypothetical protein VF604_10225 [Pyrinomonadaceae bacterium]|jgi:hypothetical protein